MKYSLGISNFLEEISSLSHSVVFLYFFALIAEQGFLISPCYSLELCIQMLISFLFSFAFLPLFFPQLFVRPPQTAILLFLLLFYTQGSIETHEMSPEPKKVFFTTICQGPFEFIRFFFSLMSSSRLSPLIHTYIIFQFYLFIYFCLCWVFIDVWAFL